MSENPDMGTTALDWLLAEPEAAWHREIDGTPFECAYCPFGKPTDYHGDWPNPADPGEGHYDCSLLSLYGPLSVWGENPKCEASDWRRRARDELTVALKAKEASVPGCKCGNYEPGVDGACRWCHT